MILRQKALVVGVLIFLCILLAAQSGTTVSRTETGSLPLELLRPRYGEEPRFPRDYVIGSLGRCDASEESYQYAWRIAASLAGGNGKIDGVLFPEQKRLSALKGISGLGTRSWRVGGGRVEPDGSVSFLIRFLGREKSVTVELYLRKPEPIAGRAAGKADAAEPVGGIEIIVDEKAAGNEEIAAGEEAAAAEKAAANEGTASAQKTAAGEEAVVNEKLSRSEEPAAWLVDDVLLEPPRSLVEGKYSPGGSDMIPYERFF